MPRIVPPGGTRGTMFVDLVRALRELPPRWSPVVSGRTALPILQVDLHQPHAFVVLYGARRYRCTAHR